VGQTCYCGSRDGGGCFEKDGELGFNVKGSKLRKQLPKNLTGFKNLSGLVDSYPAENDDPQPHVVVAFGLRITNCEPSKPSL
jgi:hypothetical protein